MFETLEKQLKKLDGKSIEVVGVGSYTETNAKTKVQNVAIWQNYGTDRIEPARFVEIAEEKNRGWAAPLSAAIQWFMRENERSLEAVARTIARDITTEVNRIRTGRLKASLRHKISK